MLNYVNCNFLYVSLIETYKYTLINEINLNLIYFDLKIDEKCVENALLIFQSIYMEVDVNN